MKDGYYWVRYVNDTLWTVGLVKFGTVLLGSEDFPIRFFEIGDYIETPEKYKETH